MMPNARIPALIAITVAEWGLEHGLCGEAMAAALGVDSLEALQDEELRLSPADYESLLALVYRESGREDLGLAIGSRLTVSSYGVLGHAMLSAATAGEAIRIGLDYYRLTSAFMTLGAETTPEALIMTARLDYPLPHLQRFAPEEQMVGVTAVARDLLGSNFCPLAIDFAMPTPPYADRMKAWFACPVRYNQPENRFLIDSRLLDVSLRTANALTAKHLLNLCETLLQQDRAASPGDLLQRVNAAIRARVGRWPAMVEVAEQLGMSERTLRRRLQELGTDYQREIDAVRHQLALQLLEKPEITVEQMAAVLGYSEAVSFRRAFQRWTGKTPQAWRQQVA
jgi:AraC-like DNA-binding protein